MVDRYAAEAFSRYCQVRALSPAQARAELELFDDLVLMKSLPPGEAARCVVVDAAFTPEPAFVAGSCPLVWLSPGRPSWTV